jgi:hypothetical protein
MTKPSTFNRLSKLESTYAPKSRAVWVRKDEHAEARIAELRASGGLTDNDELVMIERVFVDPVPQPDAPGWDRGKSCGSSTPS